MDILEAAQRLRPNTSWNYTNGIITQAEDGTDRVSIPTSQELIDLMATEEYKEQRRVAYPSITDLADALVHKENGDSTMYNDYISKCNAVKTQYPKPQI